MAIDKYAIMSALLLFTASNASQGALTQRTAQPLWEVATNLMTQIELNQAVFPCL